MGINTDTCENCPAHNHKLPIDSFGPLCDADMQDRSVARLCIVAASNEHFDEAETLCKMLLKALDDMEIKCSGS